MATKKTKTAKKSFAKDYYETVKDPKTGKVMRDPKTGKPVKVLVRVD